MIFARTIKDVFCRQRVVALGKRLEVVVGLFVHLSDIAALEPVIARQLVDRHQAGRTMVSDTYEVVVAVGVYLDDGFYPVAYVAGACAN